MRRRRKPKHQLIQVSITRPDGAEEGRDRTGTYMWHCTCRMTGLAPYNEDEAIAAWYRHLAEANRSDEWWARGRIKLRR